MMTETRLRWGSAATCAAMLAAAALTCGASAGGTPECKQTPMLVPDDSCRAYAASDIGMNGSGDLAIVGELFGISDNCALGPGRAHFYELSNGQWQHVQVVGNPESGIGFGSSVDISEPFALIAVGDANRAYFYRHNGSSWVPHQRVLDPGGGSSGGGFGGSLAQHEAVALDGDIAAISDSAANNGAGAVYVYARNIFTNQWQLEAALGPPTQGVENFGYSVEISGSRLIVGAPWSNSGSGSAYIYNRTVSGGVNWNLQASLSSGATGFDGFGWSVAIDGPGAIVGAPNLEDEGRAFVYAFNSQTGQWNLHNELSPDNQQADQFFGYNVSICSSSSLALVGANAYKDPGAGNAATGAAYVFQRVGNDWVEKLILLSDVGVAGDRVGETLAIRGTEAFIGVLGYDVDPNFPNTQEGGIMIFSDLPNCQQ